MYMHNNHIHKARTTLAIHISNNDLVALEQALKSFGDNVSLILNSSESVSELPLITALGVANLDAVKRLIEGGALISATDGLGQTPLDVIVDKLDSAKDLNEFTILMKSAVHMLFKSIENNEGTINQFLIYMLRMQKFKEKIPAVYSEFYPIIEKALGKLEPLLEGLSEFGLDKFGVCAEEVIRAGQILGLETTANIHIIDAKIKVQANKNQTPFSKLYLDEVLSGYGASVADIQTENRFAQIRSALEGRDSEIKLLPISWDGHEIYVASLRDNIILCNRGEYENAEFSGVKIFKAKQFPVDLFDLRSRSISATSFESALRELIHRDPVHTFPIKGQQHGTCSFVNAKSIVAPLLHLLGDKHAYATYKKFTRWMRDREIDHLTMRFMQAKLQKDKTSRELYFQLLCKYCFKILARGHSTKAVRAADLPRFSKILDLFATFKKGRDFIKLLDSKKLSKELASMPIRVNITTTDQEYAPADIIDIKALHCEDLDMQSAIIANFKKRELDLAINVELLKTSFNNDEQMRLINEITSLEDDWQAFVNTKTQEKLYSVANNYVERRKNLWVVSSIFSTNNEYESLLEIENVVRKRLN